MKNFLLIILSLIFTNCAISQVFGKYVPSNVKKTDKTKSYIDVTEQWLQFEPEVRIYVFKLNEVGIGKAFQLLDEILKVNNLDRSNYSEDKSIIQKGLDRWDIEELYYSIVLEKSEVNMVWEISQKAGQKKQVLALTLRKEAYMLMIGNK